MQLSILLPTHRHDLLACSRIAQACSWAGPDIEVIIRDNSGDVKKRELLPHFQRNNCKIIIAEPCEPRENFDEILRLARGEFVFCLADDDMSFDRAIAALPGIIERIGRDRSVVGVTGPYIIEASQGVSIINYQGVDSDDVGVRLVGYLNEKGPNVLFYSVLRREMVERIFAFMKKIPHSFSFQDQILCMLYLLNGKFSLLPRIFYLYDFGAWETAESAQKRDIAFYAAAGLDPAINALHWFLCGFEGAVLALHSEIIPDYSDAQRQAIANHWFVTMFARFKGHPRLTFGSSFAGETEKLCAKLKAISEPMSFERMLTEITNMISLFSKSQAQNYFDFWNVTMNKRKPIPSSTEISTLRVASEL